MNKSTPKIAVIMVNLGSPKAANPKAVRHFLREFLSDTRVVELPKWLWQIILNGIVLAVRPKKSAAAYRKIWMGDKGSPLTYYSQSLANKVQAAVSAELEGSISVHLSMRYGEPSIRKTMKQLEASGVDKLLILPLYPQYSATTTATVIDEVGRILTTQRNQPEVRYIKDYHDDPAYISAMASAIQTQWKEKKKHKILLFSFHGLPKRCVERGDPYRAQSEKTAAALAQHLKLSEKEWALSFQSRFGAETWLQPYTTDMLETLIENQQTDIDVYCPGFAVDCLETLEEIAIEARQDFLDNGGEAFRYLPALNDSSEHVRLITALIKRHSQGWLP